MLVLLRGKSVVGASVLSFEPHSLDWRLLARTPMLFFALFRFYRLPFGSLVRETLWHQKKGTEDLEQGLPELVLIFVSPTLQGQGLGGRMLEECETLLKARSIGAYTARTADAEGNRGLNFYLTHGFQIAGKALRHGTCHFVLHKDLDRVMPTAFHSKYSGGGTNR